MFEGINFLAVLAATVAGMAVGFIWYGPLFGKLWMKESGLKAEDIKPKDAMKANFISIVTSFITFWGLALVMKLMGTAGALPGILAGAGMAAAFIVTSQISTDAYQKYSFINTLIHSAYRLVALAAGGFIIGVW
jgi:hypothetical protein